MMVFGPREWGTGIEEDACSRDKADGPDLAFPVRIPPGSAQHMQGC